MIVFCNTNDYAALCHPKSFTDGLDIYPNIYYVTHREPKTKTGVLQERLGKPALEYPRISPFYLLLYCLIFNYG